MKPKTIALVLVFFLLASMALSLVYAQTDDDNGTTTAPTSIYQVSTAPKATLMEFALVCVVLIVFDIIAYLFFPLLGLAMCFVGIVGTAYFWDAQTLIVSQYTLGTTTYYQLMPIGYYILLPMILAAFSAAIPVISKHK
jgi:hypothetical protein